MDAVGPRRNARMRELPPTQQELRQRLRALTKKHRTTLKRLSERLDRPQRYLEAWVRSRDDAALPERDFLFLDPYFGGELSGTPEPPRPPYQGRRRW